MTTFVESFLVSLSEKRLDTIVPPEIIIVTIPIYDVATPISACITGQPDPKSESGSPKLMNARYISASKKEYKFFSLNYDV